MSDPPQRPTHGPDRTPLRAVLGALGYVVGVFGFTIAVSLLLFIAVAVMVADPAAFEALLEGESMVAFVGLEAGLLTLGAVIAAALSIERGWVPKQVVGLGRPSLRELGVGVVGVLVLLALALVLSIAMELFGTEPSEHTLFVEDASTTYYLALAGISILLIGPAEELLFRGLIQNYLRPAFGALGAVVGTSIIFAVVHLPAYFTDTLMTATLSLFVVFALSLVLGGLYERYRNLWLVMGVHGVYNAVLFSSQLVV